MNLKSIVISLVSLVMLSCNNHKSKELSLINSSEKPKLSFIKLERKAKEALKFCKIKKFNTNYCILVDISVHSGLNRFILWDFAKNKAKYSFLVGHGCGGNEWGRDDSKDNPIFSNVSDSHCSSLGKYKIGERGFSSWGVNIKYLMHGLDETNDNALKRVIVLHAWDKMTDNELFPVGSPEGWGCPTLSNNNFKKLDLILKNNSKPFLMWIYI